MSAKDAEVTDADRQLAGRLWNPGRWSMSIGWTSADEARAQVVANFRRDAYRAGQIAGLEECMTIFTDHCKDDFADSGELDRICEYAEARIRELKGEGR